MGSLMPSLLCGGPFPSLAWPTQYVLHINNTPYGQSPQTSVVALSVVVLTRDVTSSMPTLVVIARYLDKFCSVDPAADRVYQQKNAMRLNVPYSVGRCGCVFYDYRVTYSHDYLFTYVRGMGGVYKDL